MGLHLDSALPNSAALPHSVLFIMIMHVAPITAQKMAARTPAQCQRQSRSARHTEHFYNQHIATLVGPDVTWIQRADEVDHLRQAFERKGADEGNPCSHEPQDDIDLQHCQRVP